MTSQCNDQRPMALLVIELNGWAIIVLLLLLCFYVKKDSCRGEKGKAGKG
jgi:hypothetical protein